MLESKNTSTDAQYWPSVDDDNAQIAAVTGGFVNEREYRRRLGEALD